MKLWHCIVLAVLLLMCGCRSVDEVNNGGSFTAKKTYSYDQAYYAIQEVDDAGGSRLVRVLIYAADGTLVHSFSPARALDFWGICWERDTYNIWVQSGDTGLSCYAYADGRWTEDPAAVCPQYIQSKYDDIISEKKAEGMETIPSQPPLF